MSKQSAICSLAIRGRSTVFKARQVWRKKCFHFRWRRLDLKRYISGSRLKACFMLHHPSFSGSELLRRAVEQSRRGRRSFHRLAAFSIPSNQSRRSDNLANWSNQSLWKTSETTKTPGLIGEACPIAATSILNGGRSCCGNTCSRGSVRVQIEFRFLEIPCVSTI